MTDSNEQTTTCANVGQERVVMPSDAEKERLFMLAEEAGEVVQMVGKTLRHGYDSTHPSGGPTNKELLRKEIADFLGVLKMMTSDNDDFDEIWPHDVERACRKKYQYAHRQ